MRSDDPAAAHIMQLVDGFWPIHVLAALAQFKIPEALADGPATAADVAQQLGLREYELFRLLRAGSALGVCQDLGGRRFALTRSGELLRGDVEGSLRGEVLFYSGQNQGIFTDIPEIVRSGEAGHSTTIGPEGFEARAQQPDLLDNAQRTMVGSSRDVAVDLLRLYDFSQHQAVVDVGGGYGGLLCEVLKAYPHLTGKVFDLPHVERGALAYQASQGLTERAGFVPGSFFDGPPPPADLYLLKNIIHDWDNERSRQIFTSIHNAMSPDSVLLLIDKLLPDPLTDTPTNRWYARHDMAMMGYGGAERSEAEMFSLLESTGLRPVRAVGKAWSVDVTEVRAG